jgi:hypothetical protein
VARARVEVRLGVVLRALVLVLDEETNRRAKGYAVLDAGLEVDEVLLVALGKRAGSVMMAISRDGSARAVMAVQRRASLNSTSTSHYGRREPQAVARPSQAAKELPCPAVVQKMKGCASCSMSKQSRSKSQSQNTQRRQPAKDLLECDQIQMALTGVVRLLWPGLRRLSCTWISGGDSCRPYSQGRLSTERRHKS